MTYGFIFILVGLWTLTLPYNPYMLPDFERRVTGVDLRRQITNPQRWELFNRVWWLSLTVVSFLFAGASFCLSAAEPQRKLEREKLNEKLANEFIQDL